MQKAYLNLIKWALAQNCTISVFDGEAWAEKKSTKYNAIKEAIESVDESELRIRDAEGNFLGWALILTDLNPEETVADHSANEFMEGWWEQYYAKID